MAQLLVWDAATTRLYETGVDRVVIYPIDPATGTYPAGASWSGITAINLAPKGGEPNPVWADNVKYLDLMSPEEIEATIEAITYPDEFALCDGSAEAEVGVKVFQQERLAFGLCWRTYIGNDTEGNSHGYKLHIMYGCKASPSDRNHQTVNESPETMQFSWSVTTTPLAVSGYAPTALLEIDSTKVSVQDLATLETILYGVDSPLAAARLPLPAELLAIFA